MSTRNALTEVAQAEIGYLEKKSLKDLDSKTANAGHENYTKYWRDMCSAFQGQPWCQCFVYWCFAKAYGYAEASRLMCGGDTTYYTPTAAQHYKNNGRWGTAPVVGAQIFFVNSERIYHTGIVESYSNDTVTTIEGNTSTAEGVEANGGGVWRKTYQRNDPRIAGYGIPDYKEEDMIYSTPAKFLAAVRQVYLTAKAGNYRYGDSKKMPPTSDGVISCDRLIAKACWDLGWTDQPVVGATSGITVINMEEYFKKWGWKKITSKAKLQKGDVVLMKKIGTSKPDASWHSFVLTAYDPATGICSKYDEGSQERIKATQPFKNVPLNEWPDTRTFYCGFRVPVFSKKNEKYVKNLPAVYLGKSGSAVRLLQKLLRYANCKGKDGKVLEVDGDCGENTVHAINVYQTRKRKQGIELGTNGVNDGVCGEKMWKAMVG